ncbi:MAG TPA: O-antigen ligase family protein [Thermoguttaceae bacterium]|nr:O-antigen ligase family protein [Thermoguttaceae bacterium]
MNGLILTAVFVGAIWCAVFVLRAPLLLAAMAAVIIGAGFGYPFMTFTVASTHWTLDRVLLPLLIAAFLVQRQQGVTAPKPWGWSEWLLAAFLAWLSVSLLAHDFRATFADTATPVWRWFTAYAIPILLYTIARQSSYGRREINWIHGGLALFGVYLAVTGICEILHWWWLVFPKHIADPTVGLHFGRARGPMVTAVSYGLYLGTSFLCLWMVRERLGKLRWLVLPPLVALEVTALYYSYTRSCWMGAGLGTLLVLGLSLRGRTRIVALTSLVLGASVLLAAKMDSIVALRREQTAQVAESSAEARLSFAYVSWEMFKDSPVWGVGFGQFPTAKMPYLADRVDLPLADLRMLVHHNTFLSLLTETGIVGLGLFVALLAAWGRHAWRLHRDALAPPWARRQAVLFLGVLGLYVCQLMFHELSYSTIDNCLVFVLAGATTGIGPAWSTAAASARAAEPEPVFAPTAGYTGYRLVPR